MCRSTYNKCVRQLACFFLHLNLLFVLYFQWLLAITVIWRFFSLKALSFFLRYLPFDHEFGVGNAAVSVQIHFSETFCHLFFFIRNKSHIGNDLELYWIKQTEFWDFAGGLKYFFFFRGFVHNWANFYKNASWISVLTMI